MIIADGLKGTDDVAVPVRGGEYVDKAMIGRAVMDADIVISLNHFKGHEEAGFGGALKTWAWAAAPTRASGICTAPAVPASTRKVRGLRCLRQHLRPRRPPD